MPTGTRRAGLIAGRRPQKGFETSPHASSAIITFSADNCRMAQPQYTAVINLPFPADGYDALRIHQPAFSAYYHSSPRSTPWHAYYGIITRSQRHRPNASDAAHWFDDDTCGLSCHVEPEVSAAAGTSAHFFWFCCSIRMNSYATDCCWAQPLVAGPPPHVDFFISSSLQTY